MQLIKIIMIIECNIGGHEILKSDHEHRIQNVCRSDDISTWVWRPSVPTVCSADIALHTLQLLSVVKNEIIAKHWFLKWNAEVGRKNVESLVWYVLFAKFIIRSIKRDTFLKSAAYFWPCCFHHKYTPRSNVN